MNIFSIYNSKYNNLKLFQVLIYLKIFWKLLEFDISIVCA